MIAPYDENQDGIVDNQWFDIVRHFYGDAKDHTTRLPIIVLNFANSSSLKYIGS
jgi:hypothetical protein